ncbi:DUF6506 family protein [Agrococcus sp. ARC_14]|uniref:DUF6506 family protein n=1 Tax=Agrococcus sp. ARC_14 TaxID=2919927 RepID=UPI001F05B494|nr:DUF6506 family protein [Agrococcus sp. ARC_14]
MAFHQWGFIYLGSGTEDPSRQCAVIEHGGLRTTFVAVPDRAAAVTVAVDLVADGAQSLELCGAFGPADASAILAATGGRVPVGVAMYGMESVPKLAALFADEQ